MSAGNYVDAVARSSSFSHTTAILYSSFNLGDSEDAERIIGARTTAGFFEVFGTAPALGRVYSVEEDQPGREQVVVLSHRLWARRFGSDRQIVGREIRLSGRPYEVIGVMPASFDFTDQSEELWVPIAFDAERKAQHDEHTFVIYARLKPGVPVEQARSELAAVCRGPPQAFPERRRGAELRGRTDDGGARRRLPAAPLHPARGGRLRPAHRLRQHRQPAARARGRPGRARWRFAPRSAPAAGGWSVSSSPRAWCSR